MADSNKKLYISYISLNEFKFLRAQINKDAYIRPRKRIFSEQSLVIKLLVIDFK